MVHHALRGFVKCQAVAVPRGNRAVHLHGVVGFDGRHVGVIDLDRGLLVRRLSIAARILGTTWSLVHVVAARLLAHRRLLHANQKLRRLIRNLHMERSVLRLFEGISHHERDVLAVVINVFVFKRRPTLARAAHLFQRARRPIKGANVAVM